MNSIIELYTQYTGQKPLTCESIAGGGSNRQYYRLTDEHGHSIIGVVGTSIEENSAFIYLSNHFAEQGLPVPNIIAVSADGFSYLQTDLGNTSLYDSLKSGRESSDGYSPKDIELLEKTISILPKIQVFGAKGLDFTRCYPQESMNEQNVMFDLNYFKYCFLKTSNIEFNEVKLDECFVEMARNLGNTTSNYFMYRDFQARNVMLKEGREPYFIDYQGGRRGPLQYDLISFLWQASSHFNTNIKSRLIEKYIQALKQYITINEQEFRNSIPQWVLFRTLQVLGAYGFRGRYERKKYFLDSIPAAIENLREVLLNKDSCPYPYLYELLSKLVNLPEFQPANSKLLNSSSSKYDAQGQLKIRIFSFSYKKGIPEDSSGNGGGYVFDCRSTHNPGRYEPYKKLTGLDQPVIDFLEDDGEITIFLDSVYKLADTHVERYMKRGFTSLMFSFGCTGGQHRSVYSAQHLAEHLNEKYGIEVSVTHREQGISHVFPAKRKAMIFAAGLGTRLKPLTDHMPKALVPIAGKPLIEHVLGKLVSTGFNDIVINVHHHADMIEEWASDYIINNHFKERNIIISFSDERSELLDTGGGILHASKLLKKVNPERKFLVHNVDIVSNVNIDEFWNYSNKVAEAVLLVSIRKTSRYLVFNNDMRLVGWTNIHTGEVKSPYEEVHVALSKRYGETLDVDGYHLRAFAGIHHINVELIELMSTWPNKFSVIDFYINICDSANIYGYTQENLKILDVGKLDSLEEAENLLQIL